MTKEKIVYGLPDHLSLKDDEVAVYPEISEDYVSGMGFAPTAQARHRAYMGYKMEEKARRAEALSFVKSRIPKSETGGAPYKNEKLKIDNQRAYLLCYLAQDYKKSLDAT